MAQDAGQAFSGAHAEVLGGWDRVQGEGTHDDGVLYGVGAGYDLRRGNAVFGIEGEASDSTQKENVGALTEHASRDLYVGGRVGAVVGGNNLLYAKAGYTDYRQTSIYSPELGFAAVHPHASGFRLGAGAEFAVGRRAFVKAEYRFTKGRSASTATRAWSASASGSERRKARRRWKAKPSVRDDQISRTNS
jgi:outer membrane immunogenic protein